MSINACAVTISNTPGTSGAFTVAAAVAGPYRAPASGDNAKAVILFVREGSAWEICASVYTHSGTSFSRGTLRDSSTGSRINFTAAAVVNVIGQDAAALGEVCQVFGPFADSAALQTARPAAQNAGRLGFVGGSAPYAQYVSNGTAWVELVTGAGSAGDPYVAIASSGTAQSINISTAGVVDLTLTANCALTITGAVSGFAFSVRLVLRQDSVGSRTVTWPANTRWGFGAPPILSSAANAIDEVVLTTVDAGATYFGDFVAKGRA